jgi:probable phosphoglycerate mutase
MKLVFVRHGDPDYENDTLTEKGRREAELLADIIDKYNIDEVYQSPLGRAKDTAAYSLKKLGLPVTTLDWLQEFPGQVNPNVAEDAKMAYATELVKDPNTGEYSNRIMWDMLPSYYGQHPELFDVNAWKTSALFKGGNAVEVYDKVIESFDSFLAEQGYVRDGLTYKVVEGNDKTIAFFCHYGITCLLLSRLWNTSPFVPMQFTALAPTSVTVVASEERQKGIGIFRTLRAGDISHLVIGKEEPSFSARFCERFENEHERH